MEKMHVVLERLKLEIDNNVHLVTSVMIILRVNVYDNCVRAVGSEFAHCSKS